MSATTILHKIASPVEVHAADKVLQQHRLEHNVYIRHHHYRDDRAVSHVMEPTMILTLLVKWSS